MSEDATKWYGLAPPAVAPEATGAGVSVAVIDTGVNFAHPHLAVRGDGAHCTWDGDRVVIRPGDFGDSHGHGTCCAALVHLLAPGAELYAVRVTEAERPTTDRFRLLAGIEAGLGSGAQILLVALGTKNDPEGELARAVELAVAAGAVIVGPDPGDPVLPASAPGALAVAAADGVDAAKKVGMPAGFWAEGRARPPESKAGRALVSNFAGPSLAAARLVAALARVAEQSGKRGASLVEVFSNLLEVR